MNKRLISWSDVSTGVLFCGTAGMVCMHGISTHELTIKDHIAFVRVLHFWVN